MSPDWERPVRPAGTRSILVSRRWTLGAIGVSILVCFVLSGLHFLQRQSVRVAAARLETLRQTRLDLGRGFLHATLAGDPGSPFNREQGVALLAQALVSFEHASLELVDVDQDAVAAFRQSMVVFERSLSTWQATRIPKPGQAAALRIAFGDLERQAQQVDMAVQRRLQSLAAKLDMEFVLALGVAALLLGGLSAIVFLSASSEKRATAALYESEAHFRSLVGLAPVPMCVYGGDGRLGYFNDRFASLFGYVREDIRTLETWWSRACPDEEYRKVSVAAWEAAASKAAREGADIGPVELDIACRRGGMRSVELFGMVVGDDLVMTFLDWTERRRAEAERIRLVAAIEQAAELVLVTDIEGCILYGNPAFEQVTGYGRDEILGQSPRFLKSGVHGPEFYQALWATISGGGVWQGRIVNRRKDGTVYSEEATISPVRDASGRIVNYVAVGRDISKDLALEEQVRQSQKMEAIGQLAGGVAHDFNNILQAMMGYCDVLLESVGQDTEAYECASEIAQGAARAAALTRQLLTFSRRQIMAPADLDLNSVVEEMLKMLRRVIGEDIRLAWIPGYGLGRIHADAGMLGQVLMNLSVNARDAMPHGGVLTIETRSARFGAEDCAERPWAVPGQFALLRVSDTGQGMDRDTLDRIYEPFFTTKEQGKGTGLGLATVYGIVKQHDGLIDVASEPGRGTTFEVYLPLCLVATPTVSAAEESKGTRGHETILLAEDDEQVRHLAVRVLRRAGYQVLVAQDGEEATELFASHGNGVALLLFDVVMPKLGGYGALERIRALHPEIPVLFVSGYSQAAGHTGFVAESGLDLLQKPYAPDALLRRVRRILDEPREGARGHDQA